MKTYSGTSLLLFLMASLIMGSCGQSDGEKYRIGVSQPSNDQWRDKLNHEINREMLFHDDATVEIRTADDDNEKQIEDIKYFIDNGFDAIVVAPNQAEALSPILIEAYRAGIPTIIFDRGIKGDEFTSFIEFDNRGIGRKAGDYAAHQLPAGAKVIEITGLEGSTPAKDRHDGFVEGLSVRPDIRLVAIESASWKQAKAERIVDSLLKIYPDVALIYAQNDLMAIGASKAATDADGNRKITILGTDAAPEVGLEAVIDGTIDATFIYPTDGHRLMETVFKVLNGEEVDKQITSPALPHVDSWNAPILKQQYRLLDAETDKVLALNDLNEELNTHYARQSRYLYTTLGIIIVFVLMIVSLIRSVVLRRKVQKALAFTNVELAAERDKQIELYRHLEDATKSKLVFFTNISHDLRTPLTLIAEPVEHLSNADYLNPSDKVLAKVANKNVKVLQRLINQILDFRKYENGKADLKLSEVEIAPLVHEWIDSFREISRSRHITLHTDCSRLGDLHCSIDVEKIERVFFNLVANAFKYTSDGGTIDLTVATDGKVLTFKVKDTGCGIEAADRERIFDRFYQVNQVRPKGSGIGLSLVKAFVEMHGGTITVDSEPDKGSEFTVAIPVKHDGEAVTSDTPYHAMVHPDVELAEIDSVDNDFAGDKPLLLLIDDNEDIQVVIKQLLGGEYNVISAYNGRDGVRLAAKYVPDLILCDIMMPVMDGLECCRIIKEELSTSHIPVLMLTACSLDEQRAQSYECGADGYVSKPFSQSVLQKRCASLIENRRRIRNVFVSQPTAKDAANTDKSPRQDINLNDRTSVESEFYNKFIKIVNDEIGNSNLNLDQIASQLGIGATQMTRKIKALTNFSPVEIIRSLRLKESRKLLLATEKTISEIAYEVGFSSPPYFSKCFRDEFGITPTELRASVVK